MAPRSLDAAELFTVRGKTALVTGGSRGIGFMVAQALVENGARVYIAARDAATLAEARTALAALGDCHAIQADLSTDAGVQALAAAVRAAEPGLHILVNNVGGSVKVELGSFAPEAWDEVMALNVKGPVMLTHALTPQLRAAAAAGDPARVVNIGSISAFRAAAENLSYGAAKLALHQASRSLAVRLASENITVNVLAPGRIPTDAFRRHMPDLEGVRRTIPLGRLGAGEDIAGAALYLCSRAGAWITGTTMVVDGGLTVRDTPAR